MSEYRQNVTNGEWVIISAERAKRPEDYTAAASTRVSLPEYSQTCPFCKGNEHKCKDTTYEVKKGNTWRVRVVPNIYAAVSRQGQPISESPLPRNHVDKIHLSTQGYGVAEVIIESPNHNANLAFMDADDVFEVIKAYRQRFNVLLEDRNIAMINIFKNYGVSAGASLEHPHSQIIATHVLPTHITDSLAYARRAYNTYGSCIFCDVIKREIESQKRVLMMSKHFIAFCPFSSQYPYEVRIFPMEHASLFGHISDDQMTDLAHVLKTILAKISLLLNDPDYNYFVRTVPNSDGDVSYYHWHIAITPRLTRPAGFELGTRIYINTMPPELAAEQLRNQPID